MAIQESINSSLNEQQVLMLRLLKKPMPAADFDQMRRLAVKLLAKQLDETIEEWESKNEINEASYEAMSKGHFRASK